MVYTGLDGHQGEVATLAASALDASREIDRLFSNDESLQTPFNHEADKLACAREAVQTLSSGRFETMSRHRFSGLLKALKYLSAEASDESSAHVDMSTRRRGN